MDFKDIKMGNAVFANPDGTLRTAGSCTEAPIGFVLGVNHPNGTAVVQLGTGAYEFTSQSFSDPPKPMNRFQILKQN